MTKTAEKADDLNWSVPRSRHPPPSPTLHTKPGPLHSFDLAPIDFFSWLNPPLCPQVANALRCICRGKRGGAEAAQGHGPLALKRTYTRIPPPPNKQPTQMGCWASPSMVSGVWQVASHWDVGASTVESYYGMTPAQVRPLSLHTPPRPLAPPCGSLRLPAVCRHVPHIAHRQKITAVNGASGLPAACDQERPHGDRPIHRGQEC